MTFFNCRQKDSCGRLDDVYLMMVPPFGILGLHHYYLHRYKWGLLYTLTLGGFLIGWFIDIFRLPLLVVNYNEQCCTDSDGDHPESNADHPDSVYTISTLQTDIEDKESCDNNIEKGVK